MISSQHNQNAQMLKYVSLITLTIQSALLSLGTRYVTSRPGPKFYATTAVFMSEVVKCVVCLIIVYFEAKPSSKFRTTLHVRIIQNPRDTAKVCVVSVVYFIRNSLFYASSSNLDAATYQVTNQVKILTTALFAVIILRKILLKGQWASLVLLLIGIVLVQFADSDPLKKFYKDNPRPVIPLDVFDREYCHIIRPNEKSNNNLKIKKIQNSEYVIDKEEKYSGKWIVQYLNSTNQKFISKTYDVTFKEKIEPAIVVTTSKKSTDGTWSKFECSVNFASISQCSFHGPSGIIINEGIADNNKNSIMK